MEQANYLLIVEKDKNFGLSKARPELIGSHQVTKWPNELRDHFPMSTFFVMMVFQLLWNVKDV